jgi:PAS domain S-box-containing protein
MMGVLDIQSPQLNAFDESDVKVMETLADQIAVAIENARLYEAVQQELAERKAAETALRESEQRYSSLFQNNHAVMLLIDPNDGAIVEANPMACSYYGYSLKELTTLKLWDINTLCREDVLREMGRARFGKQRHSYFQHRLASGDIRDVEVYNGPITVGGQQLLYSIVHDITERRRLEAQLVQSAKMASLGVMAGGIAHELRNPLGIISANIELMMERAHDPELRSQCGQKILAATQRASQIIENLLNFARPQGYRFRKVDLHIVLDETLVMLDHQMKLQQVMCVKEYQPDLPSVHGNPGLLQQVFTNLILNACNAMPNGGTLTVGTRDAGDNQVEIWFKDTGLGMSPELLSKIFDPFFTTMPVGKGTGLGLSVSYSLIQQHHGTIEVEGQLGRGAQFTIRLPCMEES